MPTKENGENQFTPLRVDVTWQAYEVKHGNPYADETKAIVPPGRYVIAVNPAGDVIHDIPVPPLYDDSVTDVSDTIARIIAAALNHATEHAGDRATTQQVATTIEATEGDTPMLSLLHKQIQAAEERGELPCPHGTNNCTTADGRWYHGDCAPTATPNVVLTTLPGQTTSGVLDPHTWKPLRP